jgi:hypothetical protein
VSPFSSRKATLNLTRSFRQRRGNTRESARKLHASAQNGCSAISPYLVLTSVCRPNNRNFEFEKRGQEPFLALHRRTAPAEGRKERRCKKKNE